MSNFIWSTMDFTNRHTLNSTRMFVCVCVFVGGGCRAGWHCVVKVPYGLVAVGAPGWGYCALWPPLRCEVLHEVKEKRQNPDTDAHTFSWQATARSHTHAVDKPSPGPRVSSLGGIRESAGIHLWQVTQFTEVFSPLAHPSVHPAFRGAASGVCGIFNFVTLSRRRGLAG